MRRRLLSERVDTRGLVSPIRGLPRMMAAPKTQTPAGGPSPFWRQLHGYREAVLVAMEILGKDQFILPPEK
jgi:hypothetical protein